MYFDFASPTRIIFGEGVVRDAGEMAANLGKCAFLVHGGGGANPEIIKDVLGKAGILGACLEVHGEPTVEMVKNGVQGAKEKQCDMVIGFGGGSVIDAAKAIAALLTNPADIMNYLEIVGRGQALVHPSAPMIAIPTTAGTGSEVTRNAVLAVPEQRVKVSMRSIFMLPRLALVDPQLTYSLPPEATASSGMDALTQVLEPFVSKKANGMVDLYCREGMARAARSLQLVYEHGNHAKAREDLAWVSLLGGLSLANAGLGAVHGFAGPIGGMFNIPHGAVCARLLPLVFEANYHALRTRQPDNPILQRFIEIAKILTENPSASVEDGIEWLLNLGIHLNITALSAYGIQSSDLAILVEKSAMASSMQANPILLTNEELIHILEQAL